MMKKNVVKFVAYIAVGVLLFLGMLIANNLLDRENILDRISQWPDLEIQTMDSIRVSTNELPGEQPVLLTYFNTECIFCQHKFEAILADGQLQNEVLLLFVTDEAPDIVERFRKEMGLDGEPRLVFLHDHEQRLKKFYRIQSVPAAYLYSQNGTLIQFYRGQVGIEKIREQLAAN